MMMTCLQQVDILQQNRRRIIRTVEDASPEEIVWIPPGFRNNILWNLGHIAVTQQLLHYRLAGQPMHVPDDMVALFCFGTSPANWDRQPDLSLVLDLLLNLPKKLKADYEAGKLARYEAYTTGAGIHLRDIESAIAFNNFHEGMHTGIISCMRRLWVTRYGRGAA